MFLNLLLLLPALAFASPYGTMSREEFAVRMQAKSAKVHPNTLTRKQALQDLDALDAAVRRVWRQRWNGKVEAVDVSPLTREFKNDLPRGPIVFGDFLDLARRYVAGLGDEHAYVMSAGDELARVSTPSTPINWSRLDSGIGLLRIDRFPDPEQPFGDKMPGMLDAAFAGLMETKGLILDLRGNAGGDPNQAARLFDHLADRKIFLYYEVVRRSDAMARYLEQEDMSRWVWEIGNDFSNMRTLEYEPEPAAKYKGKVLVLADEDTVSAGEYVISELLDNGLARVAGARTPGHSGSVVPSELPNSHLVIALPVQHVLRRDHTSLQGRGILPQYRLNPRGPHVIEEATIILRRWIETGH